MRWIAASLAMIAAVSPAAAQRAPNGRPYRSQPLVTSTYTADPAAHVFGGRIYVYASHDVAGPPLSGEPPFQNSEGNSFRMTDFVVLSMDRPGGPVTLHTDILDIEDVPWASRQMWAPDAAYKDGIYYLYFPAKDRAGAFRIGVAISKSPTGPFIAWPEPIEGSYSIDPAVFIDDDGQAYMYFGGLNGGQLQKWTNGVFDPNGPASDPRGKSDRAFMPMVARLTPEMLEFAESPREAMIVDEKGKPLLAGDEARRFFEGSWMNKVGGKYHLTYSTGTTHLLVYAVGDSPYGPFTYKGKVMLPPEGWTTHSSMVQFDGRWWLFYADSQLSGQTHLRNVKLTELFWDGNAIRTIDPFGH
ncbi:MAG: glycoside hydrolase family 43 protein [Sphingomonas sp.]